MAISTSGPIKFSDLQNEFGGLSGISLSEYVIGGVNVDGFAENPNGQFNEGNRGYFGGGDIATGSYSNEIDGIQFSDETAINPSATLAVARSDLAGVNSSHRGYFGGGWIGSNLSEIDGIQFSDETAINPSATLAVARCDLAGVNSSHRGYFGGGYISAGSFSSEIDGIQFSDETAINPSATLAVARHDLASVSSSTRGYFGGGYTGSNSNEIDGIQFSGETAINPAAILAVARYGLASVNSSVRGYFGGGYTGSNSNEIDGIQFSDETAINPSATLSTARNSLAGVNSSVRGYFGGGFSTSRLNEIDGIQFSDETAINPSATLAVARVPLAGVSNKRKNVVTDGEKSSGKGYFGGGGNNENQIDGIKFQDESSFEASCNLSVGRKNLTGASSLIRGYFAGGSDSISLLNLIDGIQFSDETAINTLFTLSTSKIATGSVSSKVKGYFGGGYSTTYLSVIDSILYSNETTSSIAQTLSTARYSLAGASSIENGYFGGGFATGATSSTKIDKLKFSDESVIDLTTGIGTALSLARSRLASASSQIKGYFAGGTTGGNTSEIDGVLFSNDTSINPTASLAAARRELAGVNSAIRGYFGGGYTTTNVAEIDGINFSNDSAINPSAVLTSARNYLAGVSNSLSHYNGGLYDVEIINETNRGYFAGGSNLGLQSIIDGIEFHNEAAFISKSALQTAATGMGSVSSSVAGYLHGSSSVTTTIQKLLFADESTSILNNTLVQARAYAGEAFSNTTGYFAGGFETSSIMRNSIEAILFSSETVSLKSATLDVARSALAGTQSSTVGYFFGGTNNTGTYYADIDGIIFTTETSTNPSANIGTGRSFLYATASSNKAYIAGGRTAPATYTNLINGFLFTTEAISTLGATLDTAREGSCSVNSTLKGYFAGSASSHDTIEDIDFTGETSSTITAKLSLGRAIPGGVSDIAYKRTIVETEPKSIDFTNNRGYFGGGFVTPSERNIIDGIQFSDETAINPSATLSIARTALAGVSSSIRGYFGGGRVSLTFYNIIDGIQFSDETAINPSATLTVARSDLAGVSSSTRGYFGGGYLGPYGEIDGIQFSDETAINPSATLSTGNFRFSLAGVSSSTRGYFGGGEPDSVIIDGIQFSDETPISLSATLETARRDLAGVSSLVSGYFGGGLNDASQITHSKIDKLTFSSETAILLGTTLSSARRGLAGVSSSIRGYFAGGVSGLAEIDGIQFSSDAAINPSAALSLGRQYLAGVSSKISNFNRPFKTKGYVGGGNTTISSFSNKIYSIDFTTEVASTTSQVLLDGGRSGLAGVNSSQRGYFGGGISVALVLSSIDGIIFATETHVNPSITLSDGARRDLAGVSSYDVGVFMGGRPASGIGYDYIDGFQFSSESNIPISDTLNSLVFWGIGTNSKTDGYRSGGYDTSIYQSSNAKFSFATYTDSDLTGTLSVGRLAPYGVSAPNASYILGGIAAGGTYSSAIDQIAYQNDSVSGLTVTLSSTRAGGGSNQSSTTGYISGGLLNGSSARQSSVEAINFTTLNTYLTATSVSEPAGSGGGGQPAGVSPLYTNNQELKISRFRGSFEPGSTGYVVGGENNTPGGFATTMRKYDIVAKTQSDITFSLADGNRALLAGANTDARGYFAGGTTTLSNVIETTFSSGFVARDFVDGLTFSTEAAYNTSYALSQVREKHAGVNSALKAFFAGGVSGSSALNSINGMLFSNESNIPVANTLPDGSRGGLSSVNSSTKGYFAGGGTQSPGSSTFPTRNVDAIDFATDSTTNPSLVMTGFDGGYIGGLFGRYYAAGANSPTKGYFAGGVYNFSFYDPKLGMTLYSYSTTTEIDGIDFATETYINPSASLGGGGNTPVAVQNKNLALFISNTISSYTRDFNFSTETSSLVSVSLAANQEIGAAGVQPGSL